MAQTPAVDDGEDDDVDAWDDWAAAGVVAAVACAVSTEIAVPAAAVVVAVAATLESGV